ncbi:MAG: S9 family peptidase [Bacteroidales bacterium]|nr:S9 family peptidase [Bacteroidales bacterium]
MVCVCAPALAQTIEAVHPANPTGRLLDFEEMYDHSLYARPVPFSFDEKETEFEWDAVSEDGSLFVVYSDGRRDTVALRCGDVSYGTTVSRNEFGIDGGIFWSPSRSRLAFYRKDEGLVSDFPLLDISSRTGTLKSIKYPMNGMASERVSLGIYDLNSRRTVWADVTDFADDRYLCGVSWGPDERNIFIQVLDRSQHEMHFNMYRVADGTFVRTLFEEHDDAWVEPAGGVYFLRGKYEFVYSTDVRDGWHSLYLCDTLGHVRRISAAEGDLEYVGNDGKSVFYLSSEQSPAQRHLYRVDVGRRMSKPVLLTPEPGMHRVKMSGDCTRFVDFRQDFNTPGVTLVRDRRGRLLETRETLSDPFVDVKTGEIRFGTVPSADGLYRNNYRLFLPADFDPAKKYPVIVYVYGGPHSQMVTDSWLGGFRMWEIVLSQRGYVVYVQDGRGTQGHGGIYERAINCQCGVVEMEDQMVGVRMLQSLPFVDASRIGVSGWSYGGFMTISLLTTYPDVFKAGACGGPVIDWKWYEVMYGERYMDTPETNPEGFARVSLMSKVDSLRAPLLIMQGMQDGTVLPINSLSFVQACVEKGKQVEFFPYPQSEHNVQTPWRGHMYRKLTEFFDNNL